MHHTVARGAGVLAVLTGASSLTIDVLTWSGVGLRVRLDQHGVLMASTVILTLIWATHAVVRSEQRPLVREIARQRGAVRDIADETAMTRSVLTSPRAAGVELDRLRPMIREVAEEAYARAYVDAIRHTRGHPPLRSVE